MLIGGRASIFCTLLIATLNRCSLAFAEEAPPPPGRAIWFLITTRQFTFAESQSKFEIYYQYPFWKIQEAVVKSETLLFSGARHGDRITGSARLFSKHCPPNDYPFEGYIDDEKKITLSGTAPSKYPPAKPGALSF